MAADEIISTFHIDPETQPMRIDRKKYDLVCDAILETLRIYGSMTPSELNELVEVVLQPSFDETLIWYYTNAKLDLETRGIIRRTPDFHPQLIEIVE